jgi:hypothetical protein
LGRTADSAREIRELEYDVLTPTLRRIVKTPATKHQAEKLHEN